MSQVHSKFKVVVSTPVEGKLDPHIIAVVQQFFAEHSFAPKSLSVEHLKDSDQLVLTIGYVEETGTIAHPPVKITCVSLGKIAFTSGVLEAAMEAAAEEQQNVICHEYYVDNGESFMALLSLG